MVKLQNNNLSRSKKHSDSETSSFTFWKPWFQNGSIFKLLKREKPELIDMTFDSKRKQGLKINKKKIGLYAALGVMVMSGIGASIVPIIKQFNAPAPKQEIENKTINDVLSSSTSQSSIPQASTIDTPASTTTDTTTSLTNVRDEIDKKVQEEVEKERTKLAEEYSKKLDDATKSVQDTNSELAKSKSDKDALQKQVDELKNKLEQSSQPAQSDRSIDHVEIPQN